MANATKKAAKLTRKVSEQGLTRYNLAAGILHLLVAVGLSTVLFRLDRQPDFAVDANYMTSAPGVEAPRDHVVLFSLNLGWTMISFLLLSAFFHFLIISPWFKARYFAGLKANHN